VEIHQAPIEPVECSRTVESAKRSTPSPEPLDRLVRKKRPSLLRRPLLASDRRELGVRLAGYSAMQRDLELVFPIKDAASAVLMTIKAGCLHKAGIINEAEKQHVHSRARTFLDDATLKDAA
jgi:hypothetical protein